MIELKNICKLYKTNNTFALQNINLSIDKGEFIAICGRSGAGKSTLINILGFLDHFTKGEYFYNNQRVGQRDFKKQLNLRKNKIGFVVQNFALIPDNSVFYNISLPLCIKVLQKDKLKRRLKKYQKC
ncbi:ATP-binding cassette domain-containing protein [Alkaliphilus crotonatoxidans]